MDISHTYRLDNIEFKNYFIFQLSYNRINFDTF